jgi:hypothetical protein
MATEFSMTGIMNVALVTQGFDEINESQSLPEQRALSRNWPMIVEAELEDSNLHFTKVEDTLSNRTAGKYGFDDAYLLPGTALHVRKVWVECPQSDRREPKWVQDDRYVYLDSTDGVIVEYVVSQEATFWSANFARGVQMKLEAVLLRIKEEYGEASQMEQAAEVHFQRARTNSSKARSPADAFRQSSIADARFGRG